MGLESATDINGLNASWPAFGDVKGEGDDHLRLIKSVLKACFPGLAGALLRKVAKSANFAVGQTDNSVFFDCSGTLTASPAAAATLGQGHFFGFYVRTGTLLIDPNGAEQINGGSSIVFTAGAWGIVFCSGTDFLVVSNASIPASVIGTSNLLDGTVTYAKMSITFGADVPEVVLDAADYLAIFDSSDGGKVKKVPVGANVPQNSQSATYTFALGDAGKHILYTGAATTFNLPTNAAVAFPLGTAISVVNNGSGAISLAAAGVTLKLAGTSLTGTRTLATKALVTLLKVATDEWYISGAGVS